MIDGHLKNILEENEIDFTKFYDYKIREVCSIYEEEHKKKSIKVFLTRKKVISKKKKIY